jgi:6-phosphofructokinase
MVEDIHPNLGREEGFRMVEGKHLGIVVGGGPAPGINSVIAAATIGGVLEGVPVLGIRDGFEHIMQGDINCALPLTLDAVRGLHLRGGSHVGTSRANPTRNPEHLEKCVTSLERLNVSRLITIGGDDTAFTAMKLAEKSAGRIRVVHVPKTIDNDLGLPAHIDTFGFQTARHIGVQLVANLMVDASTTGRWYIVIAMGRSAGHLALGIGKAAGATLTLIPEEFGERPLRFATIVDTLVGGIIKCQAAGQRHGVAVVAEGLVVNVDPQDMAGVGNVERDAHGNIRLAEINFGDMLKRAVATRLKAFGVTTTVVAKDIGYELRCADPIPYDIEYTRDLGYCAAKYLLEGGNAAMISLQSGRFVPIPFAQLLDPATGRTKVRLVDVTSLRYTIARQYMIRLCRDDFANPVVLGRLAATAGVSAEEFGRQFEYVVQWEPEPPVLAGAPH